ncbi:MAG: DUF4377 domain-containing protein [Polyangiaceae bacterium]
MAHRSLATLSTLLLTFACSSSKPPESSSPETEPAPAEPALASTAADEPPPPASATEAAKVETLFVRDQRATCEAEGPRECLQVRNTESEAWRNLFASIEGFEYEPGNSYELRVEVTAIANPPADAASLKYKLKEVVSKKKASP